MSKIIGIDLGTTNSAVAIVEGGQPKIIENKEGNRTTPSIVALGKDASRIVGLLAKRQAVTNPKNTIHGIKRFMGHRFTDPAVQKDKDLIPYEIREASNGGVEVKMGEEWQTPESVSAMILSKIKADVEEKIGEKVTEAVITVPAYFDDAQRKATKDAGAIAGLDVKRIINEPTAAALAYGFNKNKDEKVVVYDFGGGTFDVTVLEVSEDTIEVKSTGGDSHMGGEDFDQKIIAWIIGEFKKDQGVDISKDPLAIQRLKEAAEKAKHELSSSAQAEINIPFITSDSDGPKHLVMSMSRATLESLVQEYIDRSIKITEDTLKESGFSKSDINEIILVGGQTRMPAIGDAVKNFFGKEPNKSINPDEVVAAGAAIQGGVLQGDVKDVLLLDVTPLSLGIETLGGVATKLIEKNTTIPAQQSQVFSTAADNQTSTEIHITQGERPMAVDNKSLGRFVLDGIPPAPRGTPQIEVTFDLDANGILSVKAKDKTSGKEQSIRIEASSGLTDEDIERMKKDAEANAETDKKKKEFVDIKNNAEMTVFAAEKALKDHAEKIPEDTKKAVEEKVAKLKEVKELPEHAESFNHEPIKGAVDELNTEMSKIYEIMQKSEAEKGGNPPAGGDAEAPKEDGGDEVQDAEVVDEEGKD
jgi:molecular chaperone DnaK